MQHATWSSFTNGIDLGNGSVRKTSANGWDFTALSTQTLVSGDGYVESTTSPGDNQFIGLAGADGTEREIRIGTSGWLGIYENGVLILDTNDARIPSHVGGDRYRLEINHGTLRYARYRGNVRTAFVASTAPLPAYPVRLKLQIYSQNAEWRNTVMAQLSRHPTWSTLTGGLDLGNGSIRKTSTGTWDFNAVAHQQLSYGSG